MVRRTQTSSSKRKGRWGLLGQLHVQHKRTPHGHRPDYHPRPPTLPAQPGGRHGNLLVALPDGGEHQGPAINERQPSRAGNSNRNWKRTTPRQKGAHNKAVKLAKGRPQTPRLVEPKTRNGTGGRRGDRRGHSAGNIRERSIANYIPRDRHRLGGPAGKRKATTKAEPKPSNESDVTLVRRTMPPNERQTQTYPQTRRQRTGVQNGKKAIPCLTPQETSPIRQKP